jgi:hypothetical protein
MAVPEILIETFLLNLQKIIQRFILGRGRKKGHRIRMYGNTG